MSVCGNVYMKAGAHGYSLRSPETGTTASCEPPNGTVENRTHFLKKATSVLTAEPSLLPTIFLNSYVFFNYYTK